jgi:hypothetical protein
MSEKQLKAYESDVRRYFPCCPLCGSSQILVNLVKGGIDQLSCQGCGAAWHLYVGLTGLKWAELNLASENGAGKSLLNKRLKKEEWLKLAQNATRALPPPPLKEAESVAKEKEVIRRTEVIVKIRCSYCHNLYSETLDKCPHCGGKN